ncbi:hypothetical protein HBI56_057870 [Parastagonospora nodorum]|uniref:Uncharacterized protein n=2 Tax=Phaeosphaeria nodorum (strain SN15 / ATCC MYA-4574 / FGSC 10173) TaxID=321614 RepID=A0A7U2NQX4_PHANO|nr:hypothetical protein SNOG_12276 [Parastagonospora nodorum SN15]KAH3913787.1 hypothetical protein HBH56_094270 [Parastagonospora nodorum]EAT80089.1 hypothetical protein SNOG_12276 [Parastagonospora nodorum SN15]KAH3930138.1 hypothetical protein HBH54_108590 [Parastagonospora nodorum]KAH3944972.1 hypothetical protein HBH53_150850 [Parastagonospora nodorum]KAH3966949.1 hypothetical protein HBH51_142290 [Parastagonospora nodorum]
MALCTIWPLSVRNINKQRFDIIVMDAQDCEMRLQQSFSMHVLATHNSVHRMTPHHTEKLAMTSPEPYQNNCMEHSDSQTYVQPTIDHTVASHSCSIPIQQHKRKSDHEMHGFSPKKQKNVFEQDEPIKDSPFNDIQPLGPSKAEEPLTHGERWRLYTWVWPRS